MRGQGGLQLLGKLCRAAYVAVCAVFKLEIDGDEMTQETLAQKAGVTRQTIIALDAGKYVPSLALVMKIAKVFKKSVDEVFKYSEQCGHPTWAALNFTTSSLRRGSVQALIRTAFEYSTRFQALPKAKKALRFGRLTTGICF
jgi:putative transcriptional regulator